ncbi:MAG: hypothetical protein WCK91_02700 [bacterium]
MPQEDFKLNTKRIKEGVKAHEVGDKKLAYVQEFLDLLKENPGIIKKAEELITKGIEGYSPADIVLGGAHLKYDKDNVRWFEEKRHVVLGPDEKIQYDHDGHVVTTHAGWEPTFLGRGTFLSPGETMIDEETGLSLTILGRSNRVFHAGRIVRTDKSDYIKATLAGEGYFIKRSSVTFNPGFTEFKSTVKARDALIGMPYVKVIEPQLGYQDEKESWFISKWEDLKGLDYRPQNSLDDYATGAGYEKLKTDKDYDDYEFKRRNIEDVLDKAKLNVDLDSNLLFSQETRTFILLDVAEYGTIEDLQSRSMGGALNMREI